MYKLMKITAMAADSLYEPGVYLFDLKTGDETAILPVADTFSFYPMVA